MNDNKGSYDYDAMVERNRSVRFWFFILTVLVVVGSPTLTGMFLGKTLDFFAARFIFGTIGFGVGVYAMLKIFPRYWVVVPQTTAFVTTNLLARGTDNPNIPYGPGGNFALPTEIRAESGNIPLDILTLNFYEEVPTKTSMVKVRGSLQLKFELAHVTTVVGVDVSAIEHGFLDKIYEHLSERLSEMSGEDAKNHITELKTDLEKYFMVHQHSKLLKDLGCTVRGVQIASIDLPPEVQATKDSLDEARIIGDAIWMILGYSSKKAYTKAVKAGTVSETARNRAIEQFMAASKNATLTIQRIDASGLENSGAGIGLAGLSSQNKKH